MRGKIKASKLSIYYQRKYLLRIASLIFKSTATQKNVHIY